MSVSFSLLQSQFDSLPAIDTSASEAFARKAADAVLALEGLLRGLGRKCEADLAKHIEFKTNADLSAEFDDMAAYLDEALGSTRFNIESSLQLGTSESCCRSNDWLAAALYDRLKHKPYCAGKHGAHAALILTDDCLYTGKQMANTLMKLKTPWDIQTDATEIFVMVPYATQGGWGRIQRTIIRNKNVVDRGRVLESVQNNVRWMLWKPKFVLETYPLARTILDHAREEDGNIKDLQTLCQKAHEDKGVSLCFFEHKIPDYYSFPEEYANFLKRHLTKYRKEIYKTADGRHNRPLECASAQNARGEE